MRLNRRTAPSLYLGVVPVTRERNGSLALGGAGQPVDWVVEMARFPQEPLFGRLAAAGQLNPDLMPPLASAIAQFYLNAERRSDHGGKSGMAWVIDGNAEGFEEYGAECFDSADRARVTRHSHAELERRGMMLDMRRQAGFVRQCHGDLHLRNIVLLDGGPTLFDGVEFNDEISCIDVLYDLAFLLMNLWRRGLPVMPTRYGTGTCRKPAISKEYRCCRSFFRAARPFAQKRVRRRRAFRVTPHGAVSSTRSREYLKMAGELLRPPPPCLIAVGGFSGSGKSTLAYGLAPIVGDIPGALVIRSDEIRKQLCGVQPFEPLGAKGYTPEMSARVYRTLVERVELTIRGGHSAIADAVHARIGFAGQSRLPPPRCRCRLSAFGSMRRSAPSLRAPIGA